MDKFVTLFKAVKVLQQITYTVNENNIGLFFFDGIFNRFSAFFNG